MRTWSQNPQRPARESGKHPSKFGNVIVAIAAKPATTMPSASKQKSYFRRTREKLNVDFGTRLKQPNHIACVKDYEKRLYELETRGVELKDAEAAFNEQVAKNAKLLKQKQELLDEIAEKKHTLKNITALNGDLREDLLKHQPSQQMADSQIVDRYNLLSENLSSWADTRVRHFEDQWKAEHDSHYPESNIFRHGDIAAFKAFLQAGYRFGGEYLVESQVHLLLHEMLFNDEKLSFALDENENKFLKAVEDGHEALDPLRGKASSGDLHD